MFSRLASGARRLRLWLGACLLLAGMAQAAIDIEIVGGGAKQIPIAVASFQQEALLPTAVTPIIRADLVRSGLFRAVEVSDLNLPADAVAIRYQDVQGRGAEALVVGSVTPLAGGQYEIRFLLLDVPRRTPLLSASYTTGASQLRLTAHRIADEIFEKLTGSRGVFATRIAYVVKSGSRYALQVADADGFNAQTVISSAESIISPAWSPDGSSLAYVSFESKKPVVFVQHLGTGARRAVAQFKGSNSAPAWSPDGQRLAVVLTRDGLSQIYSVSAQGSGATRLSTSSGIDTEPSFSPDGQWIYFTSDRGGSPQIYRMPASGGAAQRVTFDGSYNVSPHPSPDGKSLVYVQRNGGRFNVALLDLASRQSFVLTDTAYDESPTFAPNGKMILYATELGGRGVLAVVSSDGKVKQRLTTQAGNVREPAWGPYPVAP